MWKPALIVIQNKWEASVGSDQIDQTSLYPQIVEAGADFSEVTVMRMPTTAHPIVLMKALELVHRCVRAECSKVPNTERQWWSSAQVLVRSVQLQQDEVRRCASERERRERERRQSQQERRRREAAHAARPTSSPPVVDDGGCTIL